ncbi:C-GCAxxG-C-C family (seleno)protein [Halanaerocella petrolearia]
MLSDKAIEYYQQGYSCSEAILQAVNEGYNLELDQDILRLATGFQGGMSSGKTCGSVIGSIMIINYFYGRASLEEDSSASSITKEFIKNFEEELETVTCKELIGKYFDKDNKCSYVVDKAAKLLEEIIAEENRDVAS